MDKNRYDADSDVNISSFDVNDKTPILGSPHEYRSSKWVDRNVFITFGFGMSLNSFENNYH